jgi:hypothetical protein
MNELERGVIKICDGCCADTDAPADCGGGDGYYWFELEFGADESATPELVAAPMVARMPTLNLRSAYTATTSAASNHANPAIEIRQLITKEGQHGHEEDRHRRDVAG